MTCKDQRRLAVEPQLREQFMGARLDFDAAVFGMRRIMLPDVIEMGEFGAMRPRLSQTPARMVSISSGDFSGKAAVRLARPIFCSRSHRADQPGDPAEQVGGLDRIEIAGGAQQSDRQRADRGFAERLGRVAKTSFGA